MLPNDAFLHKQGPLARVWLAAHWERKLSKTQLLQTPIPSNVDVIVDEDEGHVALRLSGQLLLGFARIYSRKAKYLQDDCSDMLLRIKVAFRGSAVIDLSHEQLHISRGTITLPDVFSPGDMLMPEPALHDWGIGTSASSRPRHMARPVDITLPDTSAFVDDEENYIPPLDAQFDQSVEGFDLGLVEDTPRHAPAPKRPRRESHRRSTAALPSAPDDADGDDSFASVGVARRAAPESEADAVGAAAADHVQALVGDVDLSGDLSTLDALPPVNALGADITADTVGFDVSDIPLGATPPRPGATPPAPASRMLSTPLRPLTLDDVAHAHLTAHTADKVRTVAQQRAAAPPPPVKGSRKRPMEDDVIEMYPASGRSLQARAATVERTMTKQPIDERCLPASVAALTEMLHGQKGRGMRVHTALSDVMQAIIAAAGPRRALQPTHDMQLWLHAIHEQACALNVDEEEFPMEVGRRAMDAPLPWPGEEMEMEALNAKPMDEGFDVSGVTDVPIDTDVPDLSMDMDVQEAQPQPEHEHEAEAEAEHEHELERAAPRRSSRRHAPREGDESGRLAPLSRMSTPELDGDDIDVDVSSSNPLAAFDTRAPDTSVHGDTVRTKRAAHVLRTKMGEDDSVSFKALSANASRRAAAGFFFEMLVLGTRDCVRLAQATPYGDIQVHAKPSLQGM